MTSKMQMFLAAVAEWPQALRDEHAAAVGADELVKMGYCAVEDHPKKPGYRRYVITPAGLAASKVAVS